MVKQLHAVFILPLLVKILYQVLNLSHLQSGLKSNIKLKNFMVLYFVEHGQHSGFLLFIPWYSLITLSIPCLTFPRVLAPISTSLSTTKTALNVAYFSQTGNFGFISERSTIERPCSLELRCVYLYVCPFLILIPILIKSRIWNMRLRHIKAW